MNASLSPPFSSDQSSLIGVGMQVLRLRFKLDSNQSPTGSIHCVKYSGVNGGDFDG